MFVAGITCIVAAMNVKLHLRESAIYPSVFFKNFKLTNWRKSGMQKASDNLFLAGKLFAVGLAAVLATGCISAKSPPTDEAAAAEPAAPVEEAAAAAASAPAAAAGELTSWTVVDGNHLWGISAMEEVYNIPEKWPLIYKSNLDQIALLLESALRAREKVLLKMNVAGDRIDELVKQLPSLHAPTINRLYGDEWLAVETVVSKSEVRKIIPTLKAAGAEGILEFELRKMVI